MRGELRFRSGDPEAAAAAYVRELSDSLLAAHPRTLQKGGVALFARPGLLISSWNLLAGVTSLAVEALPSDGTVIVRYRIRFTTLTVLCCLVTALVYFAPGVYRTHDPSFVAGLGIVWGGLFGVNVVLAWIRIRLQLRTVACAVTRAEIQEGEEPR